MFDVRPHVYRFRLHSGSCGQPLHFSTSRSVRGRVIKVPALLSSHLSPLLDQKKTPASKSRRAPEEHSHNETHCRLARAYFLSVFVLSCQNISSKQHVKRVRLGGSSRVGKENVVGLNARDYDAQDLARSLVPKKTLSTCNG